MSCLNAKINKIFLFMNFCCINFCSVDVSEIIAETQKMTTDITDNNRLDNSNTISDMVNNN